MSIKLFILIMLILCLTCNAIIAIIFTDYNLNMFVFIVSVLVEISTLITSYDYIHSCLPYGGMVIPITFYEYYINDIPLAAKEMNIKIKMRKKRNEKIYVLKHCNYAALRVFADQLELVKY